MPFDRTAGLSASAMRLLQDINAALRQRKFADTEKPLGALIALAPTHPEVLRVRAAIAHIKGHRDDAIDFLRRVLAARPYDLLTQRDLGNALMDNGDSAAAIDAFRRCTEIEPARAGPWIDLARAHDRLGESDRSYEALQQAIEREPDNMGARMILARVLQFRGRIAEAEAEYRRVLAAAPHAASAWYGLSTVRTARFGADDLAAIEKICARADLREQERAPALFALAKAYEDADRYADAFKTLTAANGARRRQLFWDAAQFSKHAHAIEQAFAAPVAAAPDAALGNGIVFIVGLPRSGSTLVEQILSAHPDVSAGGELETLNGIVREESQRIGSDFPAWVGAASADDWQRLGQSYLDRTASRRGARSTFTDKGLMNWRYIGAIRAMLPGARIIDCRRDAVETCLGAFRQMFATELAFTYDLAELASFWRDYDRAMRFWREHDAADVFELSHESLLAEPEAEIRKLLAFCGLPFDERCINFHEVERDVRTSSAAQVREPLRANTARARHYGALLDPLREMLAR